jgi:flagellar biosynthesis protein FlhG
MRDQADRLRLLKNGRESKREGRGRPRVRSLAVVSGKGGVGKSLVVTNLAVALARLGKRVLLVDGDLSLANIDLLLGMIPRQNLGDVVFGAAAIEDVLIRTPSGVLLLPAASGTEELANLDDFRRESLIRELSKIERGCDRLLLDTAPGIGRQTVHFASAADSIWIVTTPEPTAFSDAYATLKVLSRRRRPERLGILVNRVRSREEARDTAERIRAVSRRFLGFEPEFVGHVEEDPAAGHAVLRQEPLLEIFPHSPAAACLQALAVRLLEEPMPPEPISQDPETYFDKVVNLDG